MAWRRGEADGPSSGSRVTPAGARPGEEQAAARTVAALRRVFELSARGASAGEVLRATTYEASWLAGVDFTTLLQFEPDGSTRIVALFGAPPGVAVGMRASGAGDGAIQRVWRTGRPARADDLSRMSGHWPQVAHGQGFSGSAAAPIMIDGALWGVLVAVAGDHPLPAGTEDHLSTFGDLAGTAIAAAQARRELQALAEEQAALRRVAELVARGTPLDGVFAAVAVEASVLLGDVSTSLVRYDDAESGVVVAVSRSDIPVGLRFPVGFRPHVETGPAARPPAPLRLASMQGTPGESAAAALGVTSVVAVPVVVEGRVWGMLNAIGTREPPPPGTEERLAPFAELAAAAIANAENRDTLRASRARIVASADEARRRLQRDVHDTAQQRLVHATIALKLARRAAGAGEDPTDLLDEALRHAERAAADLRDVVHGILPAALNHGGLGPGLESLVDDLALPVELQVTVPRLPVTTETTAYFVVAEALANVVKHASATHATVVARLEGQALVVDVRDDGRGGADPARGTGLTGLLDRVEAGDGVLTVSSPPGAGTVVHIELPVGPGHTPPGQRDAAR